MPGFLEKLRGGVVDIYAKLSNQDAQLKKLTLEFKDMLDTNMKLVKQTEDVIQSYKAYTKDESESSDKELISAVPVLLTAIEKKRTELVVSMQSEFITPLNKLADEWKKVSTAMKDEESAKKAFEKAKADLEKSKTKSPDKLKPGEVEQAEVKCKASEEKAGKCHEEMTTITAAFAEEKARVLKEISMRLIVLQSEFYKDSAAVLDTAGIIKT